MKFGRVEGIIEPISTQTNGEHRLRVYLETSREWQTIRDEIVSLSSLTGPDRNLSWYADQYTQETIGVDLAVAGWEVIGASDLPEPVEGEIARSATYAVRLL